MSAKTAAQAADVGSSLALPEEFMALDVSTSEVVTKTGAPYLGFLHPKTRADQQNAVTQALGAVPQGQAYLSANGDIVDPGKRATVLLAEFRCWARFSWGDGPKLEECELDEPAEDSDTDCVECYTVMTLTLGQTADEAPIVAVSRMLKSQCAWVNDCISGIRRVGEPDWLAKISASNPALGAALAKVPPRFRASATIRGRLKGSGDSAYVQTRASVTPMNADTWTLLGAALSDPSVKADMETQLEEFRRRRDEMIEKSREEKQPKKAAASRRGRR